MKKTLIANYYLVIIGWCIILNGYDFLALGIIVSACLLLLFKSRKINYWRAFSIAVLSYSLVSFFLFKSGIPYYFPKLNYFLFVICINNAILNEHILRFKDKILYRIILVSLVCVLVSCFLVRILPNDVYTMFTKNNLLTMVSFIFLPYLFSPLICVINRLVCSCKLQPNLKQNAKI